MAQAILFSEICFWGYKFLLHNYCAILQSYILASSAAISAHNNFQGLILGVYMPIYPPVATALIVLDGKPASPKKGHSPQFSAHVCCGLTALWIKMLLCTEVGLRPGDIVLDGDPALPLKAAVPPTFRPMSAVAKRLDRSRRHLVRR